MKRLETFAFFVALCEIQFVSMANERPCHTVCPTIDYMERPACSLYDRGLSRCIGTEPQTKRSRS